MTEEEIRQKAEEYANKIEKELLEEYSGVSETLRELVTVPTPHRELGFIDGVKYGLHEGQSQLTEAREIIAIMFPIFKTYYLNQPIENYKSNIDYIDVLKRAEQLIKENKNEKD